MKSLRTILATDIDESQVISFDVFDTLITRRVDPHQVIEATCRYLCDKLYGEVEATKVIHLIKLRNLAWNNVLKVRRDKNIAYEDASFDEMIPEWLTQIKLSNSYLKVNSNLINELINFEVQLEKDVMTAVPVVKELVHELYNKGIKLIYVSDMYHSKKTIDEILRKCGYANVFHDGFVSGELGLLKRTTNLFKHLTLEKKIDIAFHIGDDLVSDFNSPRSVGVPAIRYVDPEVTMQKNLIARWSKASKKNRYVSIYFLNSIAKSMYGKHVDIWTQIYSHFSWLVSLCLPAQNHTVLFPAREGLVLRECVKAFVGKNHFLYYVPFNRVATSPTLTPQGLNSFYEQVARDQPDLRLIDFTYFLGLSHRETLDICKDADPELDPTQTLLQVPLSLRYLFLGSKRVLEMYIKSCQNTSNSVTQAFPNYSELKTSEGTCYFVDLGWNASVQRNLRTVVDSKIKLKGLYFGVNLSAFDYASEASNGIFPLVTVQNVDFFSHPSFCTPQLIEIPLLALHVSPRSTDVDLRKTITLVGQTRRAQESEILKIQKNSVAYANTLNRLRWLFEVSKDDISSFLRVLSATLILIPDSNSISTVQKMRTEYGFDNDKKYPLLNTQNGFSKRNNLRASVWRYGAAKFLYGSWFSLLLVIYDFSRFKIDNLHNSTSFPKNILNSFIPAINSVKTDDSLGREYFESFGLHLDSHLQEPRSLQSSDLHSLYFLYKMTNFVRILLRRRRFANFSLPYKQLIRLRLLSNI